MNHRTKVMAIASLILFVLLIGKSIWIDPVGGLEGDYLKYKNYAELAAPLQGGALIWDSPVFTYKVVSVKKTSEEGNTKVAYKDEENEWQQVELQGQYTAKVRSYLFGVFPVRDIRVKGGLRDGE